MEDEKTELKTPSASRPRESRFTPGSMLADRFRIVALLGKGGMGEVYRADDIKLGQPVALKFLQVTDSAALERLYREVRLGRQVSHPNVCRVYDVTEWEGFHCISMEYIDGEDLASLLRRIGRLPRDKAIDIARDLCAGLAAAHSLGITHRDLKPANVMIDGRGTARITDFGLAGLIDDPRHGEVSGTPGYMAPEQLAGGQVTARTDLYALGLILSEIFTGKRGLTSHESLDPAIQHVIVRCLEPRAEMRPASVQSVIAALPGGDPLQAVLDAGETPSPEMVAAAGETGELRPAIAWALLIAAILLIVTTAAVSQRAMLYGRVDLPKKPDVLAERAREILAGAGYPQTPRGIVYTLGWNTDYFERGPRDQDLNRVIPSPVVFYYHESPRPLVALGPEFRPDAALAITHMARVELDPRGRLIRFTVVPPDVEEPVHKAVDWSPYIAMTGIDAALLHPVAPKWRAPVDSDAKGGWEGGGLRVEAASKNGKPVWFSVIPPWQKAERTTFVGMPNSSAAGQVVLAIVAGIILSTALLLARRNLRRARSDRRGAVRLALLVFAVTLCLRIFRSDHVADITQETRLLAQLVGESLAAATSVAVMYLAVEPYFRRRWPRLLIAWARLIAGRFRDPIIGRDALIGAVAGCAAGIVSKLPALVPIVGPMRTSFSALTELRHLTYLLLWSVQLAIAIALLTASVFLLLRIVTRSSIAALLLLVPVQVAMMAANGMQPLQIASDLIVAIMIVAIFRRYGLFALAMFMLFVNIGTLAPLTLDTSVWYFGRALFTIVLMCAIAAAGFWISLAAQPAFGMALLEEE